MVFRKTNLLLCSLIGIIVFLFYAHTLNYEWKFFDEDIIYNELILPVPRSFTDLVDIISAFGLNNRFEASNPFYSDISNLRGTPFSNLFTLTLFYLFKKNSFNYHFFMLLIHLLNSILCFLTIKTILSANKNNHSDSYTNIISLTISLIWALHPANIESVLFATNFGALITYFFCILFTYVFIKATVLDNPLKPFQQLLLFFLYLIPLFLNEYSVTLPLILFSYCFLTNRLKNKSLKESTIKSFKNTFPLFTALFIFFIYFTLSQNTLVINKTPTVVTFQRIFWLSPQVLIHLLKTLVLPFTLTIDQIANFNYSFELFEPYAVVCIGIYFMLLITSIVCLLIKNKKWGYLYNITFIPVFFSLLPFLHIISPVYNLASERYLYFPSFLLVFGIAHILLAGFQISSKNLLIKAMTLTTFFILLFTYSTKAYLRTLDWKDSISLLESSISTTENNLFKALREQMVFRALKNIKKETSEEALSSHSGLAIKHLGEYYKELKGKKIQYNSKISEIIKFYGLDPDTLFAKGKFLEALIELDQTGDAKKAFEIFEPFVNNIKAPDTQIINFYYKLLFNMKKYDEAEKLLLLAYKKNKLSPSLLVALSDLNEFKYNDLRKTEEYLLKSFSIFPYDSNTLFGLRRLYGKGLINHEKFAYYSWLFGLRTHSKTSLKESALVYITLGKKNEAKKVLKNLIKHYGADDETIELASGYERKFGNL